MGLKTFKPYTKSTRGTVVIDKSNLWKGAPHKPLTRGQNFTGGRNNNGRITSRHIGGGSKHKYRVIDFHRNKIGVKGHVQRIEYDPNRSCHIMLIKFEDNDFKYYSVLKIYSLHLFCALQEYPMYRYQKK